MAGQGPTGTLRLNYEPSYHSAIGGSAGDALVIINPADANWWRVQNVRTQEEGFVPASFVDVSDTVRDAIDRRRMAASDPDTLSANVRGGLKLLSSAASGAGRTVLKGADTVKQVAASAPLDLPTGIGASIAEGVRSGVSAAQESGTSLMAVGTSISEGVRSAAQESTNLMAVGTSISEGVRSGVSAAQGSGTNLLAAAQDAKASVEQLQEHRWKQQYEERRRLWTEDVLPQWQATDASTRRVRKLVACGIPHEVRPAAWMTVVGNSLGLTRELFEKELLSTCRGQSTERLANGRAMIATDLERTFSKMGGCDAEALGSVLEGYLLYNHLHHPDESGYVQGMSFLAAVLLIQTDASGGGGSDPFPAFLCLVNLLEQPQRVLKTCLRLDGDTADLIFTFWNAQLSLSLPRLSEHFETLGVLPQM